MSDSVCLTDQTIPQYYETYSLGPLLKNETITDVDLKVHEISKALSSLVFCPKVEPKLGLKRAASVISSTLEKNMQKLLKKRFFWLSAAFLGFGITAVSSSMDNPVAEPFLWSVFPAGVIFNLGADVCHELSKQIIDQGYQMRKTFYDQHQDWPLVNLRHRSHHLKCIPEEGRCCLSVPLASGDREELKEFEQHLQEGKEYRDVRPNLWSWITNGDLLLDKEDWQSYNRWWMGRLIGRI